LSNEAGQNSDETARYDADLVTGPNRVIADLSFEERAAVAALPASSALLVVLNGPGTSSRYLLDQDSTQAGRHPEADIFLDDVTVSRRHAEFVRTPSGFQVGDLGSMNGTYVDGQAIERRSLANGDEIQIGKFRLTFFSGSNGSET
jgi:pSer/pThr/pTyr-binding forkhead associated (FHA) protein